MLSRAEKRVDSLAGEFFADQSDVDKLVREAIQNCLDARDQAKVTVRVRSSATPDALDSQKMERWVGGLRPHAAACGISWPTETRMSYLVIEDFGATGLIGDPKSLDEKSANNFYWFWRNEGRSGKGTSKRGSRGVGKWTYSGSSRIKAFFGLTVRNGDSRPLLMGQVVLKTHMVDAEQFEPWGWFASFESGDGFQVPVESVEAVEQFMRDFKIGRQAPGLSIVIPWPEAAFSARDLAGSVVQNYFYPLLSRQLLVEIQEGSRSLVRVDEVSVDVLAPDSAKLVSLTRWALLVRDGGGIEEVVMEEPRWSPDSLPADTLDRLRERVSRDERVAVRFVVPVVAVDGTERQGRFDIFCERDEGLSNAEEVYIRDGITVTGIRKVRAKPLRGILVVDDDVLAPLMRESEGPSHTHWTASERRIKEGYRNGDRVVAFVTDALKQLADAILKSPAGLDRDFLAHLFSVDDAASAPVAETERPVPDPPDITVSPLPAIFAISKVNAGFAVTAPGSDPGDQAVVEIAYGVRRGNAFKRYEAFDFTVDKPPIAVSVTGGSIVESQRNRIRFEVAAPANFRLTVTGFHEGRDVKVRVSS
jgi:hypothetical protein